MPRSVSFGCFPTSVPHSISHGKQCLDFHLAKTQRFAELAKFLFAKPLFSLIFSVITILFVVTPFEFLCALCVSSRLCESFSNTPFWARIILRQYVILT